MIDNSCCRVARAHAAVASEHLAAAASRLVRRASCHPLRLSPRYSLASIPLTSAIRATTTNTEIMSRVRRVIRREEAKQSEDTVDLGIYDKKYKVMANLKEYNSIYAYALLFGINFLIF